MSVTFLSAVESDSDCGYSVGTASVSVAVVPGGSVGATVISGVGFAPVVVVLLFC